MSAAFKLGGGARRLGFVSRILLSVVILSFGGAADAADVYGRVYDTLRDKIYPGARVSIDTQPARETLSDEEAQFWFRDVPPGVYLVHISLPQRDLITGRLLVESRRPATIANLDISKIDPPEEDDEY